MKTKQEITFNKEKFIADTERCLGECYCGRSQIIREVEIESDGYIFAYTTCAEGHPGETIYTTIEKYNSF